MPMLLSTRAILALAGAFALGAAGCDRFWPLKSASAPPAAQSAAAKPDAKATPQTRGLALAEPTAPAEPAPMSPEMASAFDSWLIQSYMACWTPPAKGPADDEPYVAHVRLQFARDGSLAKPAKLVNPPSNPAWKPHAKSAMKAVQTCNPLKVPAQYGPYYEQWKARTVLFDPRATAG